MYARYYKNAGLYSYNGSFIPSYYDFKKRAYRFSLQYSKTIFLAIDYKKPKISFPFIYGPLEQDEYFLKISDMGSGVDSNNLSVWIDGQVISSSLQKQWNIRFDNDRQGILIPTGIKPRREKYQGDNSTTLHLLEIVAFDKTKNRSKKWQGLIRLRK